MKLPVDTTMAVEIFEPCTLIQFHSCTVAMLTAFYKMRMLVNLTDKVVLPKKGTVDEAVAGTVDKKTKSPLLLSLVYNYRRMPIIKKVPVLPPVVTSYLFIKTPTIIKFESICRSVVIFKQILYKQINIYIST